MRDIYVVLTLKSGITYFLACFLFPPACNDNKIPLTFMALPGSGVLRS
jgi:hypothetical protein